jgi:hypothetical protein
MLINSGGEWFIDYYPEEEHAIGGYVMYLKFYENGNVDLSCETETHLPAKQLETTEYKVAMEQGPVLSFNSYSKVMHYFSEPSASDINGMDGDYEFVIMKVEQNQILLKGKKHGSKMTLRRNTGNENYADHLQSVIDMDDRVSDFGNFGFVLNNQRLGIASVVDRTLVLTVPGERPDSVFTLAYTFTPDGIRLYEPFEFKGATIQNFTWNSTEEKYQCTDAGENAYFDVYFPPDYQLRYSEFLGHWEMEYHGASTATWAKDTVEFTAKKKNSTFLMSGSIFSFAGVELTFNASKGTISIYCHNAAVHTNGNNIRVCPYDRVLGFLYISVGGIGGLDGIWNNDTGGDRIITFLDNGKWITYVANGLYFRLYDSNNVSQGVFTDNAGGYRFNDITLTKID